MIEVNSFLWTQQSKWLPLFHPRMSTHVSEKACSLLCQRMDSPKLIQEMKHINVTIVNLIV
jgi:hypothetical protein